MTTQHNTGAGNAARHTPGPWTFSEYDGVILANEDGKPVPSEIVCQIYDASEQNYDNHKANAALIGSAPDLLQALHQAESTVMRLGGKLTDLAPIRSAIAKATAQ
jgi:hypothetical protein